MQRREQGFRMLGIAVDTGLLIDGLREKLQMVGREASLSTGLVLPE
jgi:hypothetical protein